MSINNKDLGPVVMTLANADTTEASFRTGVTDVATQTDDNQEFLAILTDREGAIGAPTSVRLSQLAAIPDQKARDTSFLSTNDGVVNVMDDHAQTLANDFITIFHTGTGTVTINVDENTPDGAAFYVASSGTLTMAYGPDSSGISLGNATRIASGAYSSDQDRIFFSETVT